SWWTRAPLILLAGSVFGVVLVVLAISSVKRHHHPAALPAPLAPMSSEVQSSPATDSLRTVDTAVAADEPQAPVEDAPRAEETPSVPATPTTQVATAEPMPGTKSTAEPARSKPATDVRPPPSKCARPWEIDSLGVKRWKKECL